MTIPYPKLAKAVYNVLLSGRYKVEMFDEKGTRVYDKSKAWKFYVNPDGHLVTINRDDNGEGATLKVALSGSVDIKEFENSVGKKLRQEAQQIGDNMSYDIRSYGKQLTPKDFAHQTVSEEVGMKKVKEASKLTGSTRSSYQRVGECRLIIRHTGTVNEEKVGSRSRNISQIFIETKDGERFKMPANSLHGARAMARHVSNGGSTHDTIGSKISGMMEEISQLRNMLHEARRIDRKGIISEQSSALVEQIRGRYRSIRETLQKMTGKVGYMNFAGKLDEATSADVNLLDEFDQVMEAGVFSDDMFGSGDDHGPIQYDTIKRMQPLQKIMTFVSEIISPRSRGNEPFDSLRSVATKYINSAPFEDTVDQRFNMLSDVVERYRADPNSFHWEADPDAPAKGAVSKERLLVQGIVDKINQSGVLDQVGDQLKPTALDKIRTVPAPRSNFEPLKGKNIPGDDYDPSQDPSVMKGESMMEYTMDDDFGSGEDRGPIEYNTIKRMQPLQKIMTFVSEIISPRSRGNEPFDSLRSVATKYINSAPFEDTVDQRFNMLSDVVERYRANPMSFHWEAATDAPTRGAVSKERLLVQGIVDKINQSGILDQYGDKLNPVALDKIRTVPAPEMNFEPLKGKNIPDDEYDPSQDPSVMKGESQGMGEGKGGGADKSSAMQDRLHRDMDRKVQKKGISGDEIKYDDKYAQMAKKRGVKEATQEQGDMKQENNDVKYEQEVTEFDRPTGGKKAHTTNHVIKDLARDDSEKMHSVNEKTLPEFKILESWFEDMGRVEFIAEEELALNEEEIKEQTVTHAVDRLNFAMTEGKLSEQLKELTNKKFLESIIDAVIPGSKLHTALSEYADSMMGSPVSGAGDDVDHYYAKLESKVLQHNSSFEEALEEVCAECGDPQAMKQALTDRAHETGLKQSDYGSEFADEIMSPNEEIRSDKSEISAAETYGQARFDENSPMGRMSKLAGLTKSEPAAPRASMPGYNKPVIEQGFEDSEIDDNIRDILSGHVDLYDVYSDPSHPAHEVINDLYHSVSEGSGYHPDDDFDMILELVYSELENKYGQMEENHSVDIAEQNRFRKLAGLPPLTESAACGCPPSCNCGGTCGGKCGGVGCNCACGERTGDVKINECGLSNK